MRSCFLLPPLSLFFIFGSSGLRCRGMWDGLRSMYLAPTARPKSGRLLLCSYFYSQRFAKIGVLFLRGVVSTLSQTRPEIPSDL